MNSLHLQGLQYTTHVYDLSVHMGSQSVLFVPTHVFVYSAKGSRCIYRLFQVVEDQTQKHVR